MHEGLIEDAIASLEPYASHTLVEQVVNAALQSRSHFEWVIQASRKQAEPIIEGGKAEYYHAAAKWLANARTAYQALGRKEEWQIYLGKSLLRRPTVFGRWKLARVQWAPGRNRTAQEE